jgi:signal transduction histidine kinase/CheY-like chemotaxis protein
MAPCENCVKNEARIAQLRQRITKLAREKSHLQLVADVLSQLVKIRGTLPIAKHTLHMLMNAVGGTNITFYYHRDNQWLCLDVYGREEILDEPDDEHVQRAIVSRQRSGAISDANQKAPFTMQTGNSTFEKWVFPLVVDDEILGALCVDGLVVHVNDSIVEQLDIIATYISLVLKSESLAESRIKRAYDALMLKNQQLESEIISRIRVEEEKQTLQNQLQQAQKMEAIGTLAGGIAHDFNNLLGAIIGYTDLAHDACTEGESRHHLEQVLRAADRAKDLVNQILAFSRKQDVSCAPILVAPVVKEVMKLLRASIPSTIEICANVDDACPAIFGNATNIHQIVMNLCANATHAMEETGGQLNVSLQTASNDHAEQLVQLTVTDTGTGIPEDILPRIFEPYFTTKGVGKGTGMGLAVVHGIVHSLGGTIRSESRVGKGTSFICQFPAVAGKARDSAVPDSPNVTFSGVAMVVDDESSIAALAARMLRKMGFETDVFVHSHKALEAFYAAPDRYNLVLTDQTMPELSGHQLSRLITMHRRIPIIVMSGYSSSLEVDKLTEADLSAYLPKPFSTSDLERTVTMAMRGKDAAAPNWQRTLMSDDA